MMTDKGCFEATTGWLSFTKKDKIKDRNKYIDKVNNDVTLLKGGKQRRLKAKQDNYGKAYHDCDEYNANHNTAAVEQHNTAAVEQHNTAAVAVEQHNTGAVEQHNTAAVEQHNTAAVGEHQGSESQECDDFYTCEECVSRNCAFLKYSTGIVECMDPEKHSDDELKKRNEYPSYQGNPACKVTAIFRDRCERVTEDEEESEMKYPWHDIENQNDACSDYENCETCVQKGPDKCVFVKIIGEVGYCREWVSREHGVFALFQADMKSRGKTVEKLVRHDESSMC